MKSVSDPETEFRLVKEYWLQTIQPFIAGRKLHGVEFFVAQDAWYLLRKIQGDATRPSVSGIPLVDFASDEFREPEELFRDENLKPDTLAGIAAPLLRRDTATLPPIAAVKVAHELLMAAERYIEKLPKKKTGAEQAGNDVRLELSPVQFADIVASNKKDSGQLPLLPGVYGKSSELTLPALKAAVKRHLEEKAKNRPQMTEAEWNFETEQTKALEKAGRLIQLGSGKAPTFQEWQNQPQEAIADALQNNRIILQDLCDLRFQRFKRFWEKQRHAGSQHKAKAKKPRKLKPLSNVAKQR
jgi:hypothetical protein